MSKLISLARRTFGVLAIALPALLALTATGAGETRTLTFDGVISETKLSLKELGENIPSDWSGYNFLVVEMRASSPQRFGLWAYTADGPRRMEINPIGQNAWLRASIPIRYFVAKDSNGMDLASANNRRANTFWISVIGPFGGLKSVEAVGVGMEYPVNHPTIELRNVHLATNDEGSVFLDPQARRDQFGQWALVDWSQKIKSREQLDKELADEQKNFGSPADFGYDEFGGYKDTQANATGFFHIEQINGKWWFVDPKGHLFLSTGFNGTPGGRGGFGGGRGGRGAPGGTNSPAATNAPVAQATAPATPSLTNRRLESWGMNTGGAGRPNAIMLNWPLNRQTTFLGLPDSYSPEFATNIDNSARSQCASRRDDPLVLGYFVGNEPPWGDRESEVVDLILTGPESATQTKLKEFLAAGDTAKRRKEFIIQTFEKYLETVCAAIKKYDPNHLTLGIRYGGVPSEDMLRCARVFDVCSINGYEYEPTRQMERAYRITGRPVLVGEFHIGVPENGLGAGLVQARDQTQRAIAYRFYMEQAASLDCFLGAHWFQWNDEPVQGRFDGENYNIGFIDATGRAYPEMVAAAQATNKRLMDVHVGKILPFTQRPMASDAGTPATPWTHNRGL
jgi:hypothetical protein